MTANAPCSQKPSPNIAADSSAKPIDAGDSVLPSAAFEMLARLAPTMQSTRPALARRFEAAVIREALDFTRGRKVEAAERLGIGRNTITRKIQELHLES